jgi:hypothetical protein
MQVRPIAAAVVAALTIGACGDSGNGSKTQSVAVKPSVTAPKTTTTATTPKTTGTTPKKATKAQVVATGDKACKANKRRRDRLDRVGSTAEQIAALASKTSNKVIAKYVNVLNNELGLLRRLSYARKHKQSGQVAFIKDALAKQRHRARVLARDYGFQVCGSG